MLVPINAKLPREWLVVYTMPRAEKKTFEQLQKAGLESYCPLNLVYRKWSDRVKKVEEPLFKSYVFVHVTAAEQSVVRHTSGVLNFVYWCGKPAVVKAEEIATIKRFLNEYDGVEVEALEAHTQPITAGTRVRIDSGLLMGEEGIALRVSKKLVEVRLESIGFKLVAKIERQKLRPVFRAV